MRHLKKIPGKLSQLSDAASHAGPVTGAYFGGYGLMVATGKINDLPKSVLDAYAFSMSGIALLSSLYHMRKQGDELSLFQKIIFVLAGVGSVLGSFNIAGFNPAFKEAVGKADYTQWIYFSFVAALSLVALSVKPIQFLTKSNSPILSATMKTFSDIGPFIGFVFALFLVEFNLLNQNKINASEVNALSIGTGALSCMMLGANYVAIKQEGDVRRLKEFVELSLDEDATCKEKSLWYLFFILDVSRQLIEPAANFLAINNMLSTAPDESAYFAVHTKAESVQKVIIGVLAVVSVMCGINNALKEAFRRIDDSSALRRELSGSLNI